ncbi:unnamed protein product, partial [Meganyctiphanes norvegica]
MVSHKNVIESSQSHLERKGMTPIRNLMEIILNQIPHEDLTSIILYHSLQFPSIRLDKLGLNVWPYGLSSSAFHKIDKEWIAISKAHFSLYRDQLGSPKEVYLKDLSFNGTYINGREVGKNKKSVLRNTDRITLATKETAKGFRFFD